MPATSTSTAVRIPGWATAIWVQLLAWILLTWTACEWLVDAEVGRQFDAEGLRQWLQVWLKGSIFAPGNVTRRLDPQTPIPWENVALLCGAMMCLLSPLLAIGVARRTGWKWPAAYRWWATNSGIWLIALGSWSLWRLLFQLAGWTALKDFWEITPQFWCAMMLAGMTTALFRAPAAPREAGVIIPESTRTPRRLWTCIALSVIIWGVLNTALWNALLVPHGDSAMYEEHLWNVLHGKGFRSFIDKGLFLGEHIQVIHLCLLPVYALLPSHLTLEWLQSLGLALGAWPVYRLAFKSSQDRGSALCLAVAYLLYFPMQRLDISLDFKTFRPEAFGIPLLLMTLWAIESRRWWQFTVWGLLTLLVKEDYALIFGPLGLWCWWHSLRETSVAARRTDRIWGTALMIGSVAYLWWAVKIAIPYFKAGREVHYSQYFPALGNSVDEILWNLLLRPQIWLSELFQAENGIFLLALLLPMGGLALRSPARMIVGAPLFVMLGLNSIARNPQHHFHAPLVAILFWAAAAGLRHSPTSPLDKAEAANAGQRSLLQHWLNAWRQIPPRTLATWCLACAFWTGMFHSFGPLGLPFWDRASGASFYRRYQSPARVKAFPYVFRQIPQGARVASTDFIHPRFNHFTRSYDYSSYRPDIPDDADYLVIDVTGPYSEIKAPWNVPAYRDDPERWELLPDDSGGLFYLFRRIRKNDVRPTP